MFFLKLAFGAHRLMNQRTLNDRTHDVSFSLNSHPNRCVRLGYLKQKAWIFYWWIDCPFVFLRVKVVKMGYTPEV